jgi:hypothetical protein
MNPLANQRAMPFSVMSRSGDPLLCSAIVQLLSVSVLAVRLNMIGTIYSVGVPVCMSFPYSYIGASVGFVRASTRGGSPAPDVDERIHPVPGEIPDGDLHIVAEHISLPLL